MNNFHSLQKREKIMVIGVGIAILATLIFTLILDPLLKRADVLDRQIVTAERQLAELHAMQRDHLRQKSLLDRIDIKLERQEKGFKIFSHLADLAEKTGIGDKILSIKPTVSPPNEVYSEEAVEIKMEGVTLEQLVNYLYQVENSPQLLKIKRLDTKPRLDNRQILTVTFRVSVFKLKEATS